MFLPTVVAVVGSGAEKVRHGWFSAETYVLLHRSSQKQIVLAGDIIHVGRDVCKEYIMPARSVLQ